MKQNHHANAQFSVSQKNISNEAELFWTASFSECRDVLHVTSSLHELANQAEREQSLNVLNPYRLHHTKSDLSSTQDYRKSRSLMN